MVTTANTSSNLVHVVAGGPEHWWSAGSSFLISFFYHPSLLLRNGLIRNTWVPFLPHMEYGDIFIISSCRSIPPFYWRWIRYYCLRFTNQRMYILAGITMSLPTRLIPRSFWNIYYLTSMEFRFMTSPLTSFSSVHIPVVVVSLQISSRISWSLYFLRPLAVCLTCSWNLALLYDDNP